MHKIVIVFGNNHLNSLGIVRSLGEYGIRPVCVMSAHDKGFVFDSKYPIIKCFQDNLVDGLNYIIRQYGNEQEKPIVLPSCDIAAHLLEINYEKLKSRFHIHHANKSGVITQYMDKSIIGILAKKYGLNIPRTWVYKKGGSVPCVTFPCFIKAASSILHPNKIAKICYNHEELSSFVKTTDCSSLVIQEYIDKENELCLHGFSINHGKDVYIPYQMSYLQLPAVSFGARVKMKRFSNDILFKAIKELIEDIGYVGIFSVEFIIGKNGICYFTEMNFRNDGYSYFSTKGGASIPYLYCLSIFQNKLVTPSKKIKDELVGINEIYYYAQSVYNNNISLFTYIRHLLLSDALLLFNLKDLKPVFHARIGYSPPIPSR